MGYNNQLQKINGPAFFKYPEFLKLFTLRNS